MNWFQHDSDSIQDAKIKKLLIRHGAVGYAVYFHCLELIAADVSESNLTFELEHDSEIIADNLKIKGTSEKSGIALVEDIMRYIIDLGLFTECQGRLFCVKLLKRINLSMTSSPSFREAINKKKNQYHDTIMTHHDPVMIDHGDIMLPTLPTNITLPKEAATASEPQAQRFKKPSIEEISAYCSERENHIDPQRFIDHYESNGWKIGKSPMKDWKAAIRTWEKNALDAGNKPSYTSRPSEPPEREIKGTEVPEEFMEMWERNYGSGRADTASEPEEVTQNDEW